MYLEIRSGDEIPVISVQERDRLDSLYVAVHPADKAVLRDALEQGGAGTYDGEHAWISIEFLRSLGAPDMSPSWQTELDGMLAYADAHGYLADDRAAVRAHIELSQDQM